MLTFRSENKLRQYIHLNIVVYDVLRGHKVQRIFSGIIREYVTQHAKTHL